MEDVDESVLESDHDALAEAADGDDAPPDGGVGPGIGRADEEEAGNDDTLEHLPFQATLEGADIDLYVGKLGDVGLPVLLRWCSGAAADG